MRKPRSGTCAPDRRRGIGGGQPRDLQMQSPSVQMHVIAVPDRENSGKLLVMETTTGTYRQESSNALARKRDAAILWLLERHPVTAQMLVEIGFFRSKRKATKRLGRLV